MRDDMTIINVPVRWYIDTSLRNRRCPPRRSQLHAGSGEGRVPRLMIEEDDNAYLICWQR